jgi:hypothetical protein
MLRACFAADTPILVSHDGSAVRIDQIREGDWVLSADENDPNGPLVLKQVEELFVREKTKGSGLISVCLRLLRPAHAPRLHTREPPGERTAVTVRSA